MVSRKAILLSFSRSTFTFVSLFTSIPVDVAISVAHNRLINDENLQDRTAIPITDIVKLLDFCL